MESALYSCQILNKLDFPRHIFEKYWNINLITIRPVRAELYATDGRTGGQTEKHDKATCFFNNFANKNTNYCC